MARQRALNVAGSGKAAREGRAAFPSRYANPSHCTASLWCDPARYYQPNEFPLKSPFRAETLISPTWFVLPMP